MFIDIEEWWKTKQIPSRVITSCVDFASKKVLTNNKGVPMNRLLIANIVLTVILFGTFFVRSGIIIDKVDGLDVNVKSTACHCMKK